MTDSQYSFFNSVVAVSAALGLLCVLTTSQMLDLKPGGDLMCRRGHADIGRKLIGGCRVYPSDQCQEVGQRWAIGLGAEHVLEAVDHLFIGRGVFFVKQPGYEGLDH